MVQTTPLLIGLGAGVFAGLFGVGGGAIIVPLLIILMGYSQHQANAVSLAAMLLPVGILGVYAYWKAGALPMPLIWAAAVIALGLFIGVFAGARLALVLPTAILTRIFAVVLIAIAVRLWMKAG